MGNVQQDADLSQLVGGYAELAEQVVISDVVDWDKLTATLVREHDWTYPAATALTAVVKSHGSFLLRNAAAIAIALGHTENEFRL